MKALLACRVPVSPNRWLDCLEPGPWNAVSSFSWDWNFIFCLRGLSQALMLVKAGIDSIYTFQNSDQLLKMMGHLAEVSEVVCL